MPHVSKKSLDKKVLEKIQSDLVNILTGSASSLNRQKLLRELLTETEQMMLAKRLAVIFLISRGESAYQIWKTLRISPSTVARFEFNLETKYKNLAKLVSAKKNSASFSDFVETILYGVLPPKAGSRWGWINKH